MKHLINIMLIIILTGFVIGITYIQFIDQEKPWFFLYIPWFVLAIMLGCKLNDDY